MKKSFSIPIGVLGGAIVMGGFLFLWRFGTALFQEPDTPAVIQAALQMEFKRTGVGQVNSNPRRLLVRTFGSLDRHLVKQGWTRIDQAGAVIFYEKNKQRLDANCGMFSRNYMICNLNQTP
jgi:hypothetical protein